jgi:hypothetical protein
MLNRAAEQYRELSMLVSALTSVPAPPAEVVQAFTEAAAARAAALPLASGAPGGGEAALSAAALQRAELARLFLSSGAALASTAQAAPASQAQPMQGVVGPVAQEPPAAAWGAPPHGFPSPAAQVR